MKQLIEAHLYEALESYTNEDGDLLITTTEVAVSTVLEVLPHLPAFHLAQVHEFHETFEHPIAQESTLVSEERFAFRMRMLLEEMSELAAACGPYHLETFRTELMAAEQNIDNYHQKLSLPQDAATDVLDALVDIQYFLDGTIVEFGMQEQFSAAFTEVHASNMSKAISTIDQAAATVEHYAAQNVEVAIKWATPTLFETPTHAIAYRVADGKILKNVGWRPADLKGYVKPFKFG